MSDPKPMRHGDTPISREDFLALLRAYRPTLNLLRWGVQAYLREYSRHKFVQVRITGGSRGPKKAEASTFETIPPVQ